MNGPQPFKIGQSKMNFVTGCGYCFWHKNWLNKQQLATYFAKANVKMQKCLSCFDHIK